ncbi:MAG: hypothetical protein NTZ14_17815 [Hyphomicrobiales bacterium]|nr:hypothetical protein [Hyphomicrobiales bacterium]
MVRNPPILILNSLKDQFPVVRRWNCFFDRLRIRMVGVPSSLA